MAAECRVFFALWPDDEVAQQLDEAGRKARESLGGRSMRRETLHLTLAFIGGIAPERLVALQAIAGTIRLPPFSLLFDRLQCIPRKKIAWASTSVQSPGLMELAAILHAQLKAAGFRTEARPFATHVTLLRNAVCETYPRDESLHIEWPVRDFVLVESELRPEGARYHVIQRWQLDG
ncbi:MAG: RNA 2',3'-cyclic phosphodiesterase [Rhodocyclaceae bacterium]|nr:RNA 2',3'-cyclic phosphodiesterase [Rhodocyclaceae bacterium]